MAEPIPDVQYGKANWQDFVNNWREADAEWMQERLILRYTNATTRDAANGSAGAGTMVYNAATDFFEAKRAAGGFLPFRALPQNLAVPTDTGSAVLLAHGAAAGAGLSLTSAGAVTVNATSTSFHSGVLGTDATGVTVKTGTKTVKLTTSTTDLVSDSPVSMPSLTLSGAGTVLSAPSKTVAVGTLNADSAAITNITMSGTMTGGILNGTRANVNGVQLGWDPGLTVPAAAANLITASAGLVSQQGYFYGDGSSAIMRQRTPTTGALSAQYIQVQGSDIIMGPPAAAFSVYMYPYLRIMQGHGVPWHNAAGTHVAWISPHIYSGSDPGATNYPDGTIWVS